MITAEQIRYAVKGSQLVTERTETRHGGKWAEGLAHTKKLGCLQTMKMDGFDLSVLTMVRGLHEAARQVGEMVAKYRKDGIDSRPVENGFMVSEYSAQWDWPQHTMGNLSRMTFAQAFKHFSDSGIPGWAHASTSNSLIDASSEGAMRAHPQDSKQKQLANPNWFKLPTDKTAVMLGEDGSGMDATAQSDHVTVTGYETEIAALRKVGKDTTAAERSKQAFINMATNRHNERTAA